MRTKAELQEYIEALRMAVKHPGARNLYFPRNKSERREGNFLFARELGYGLKDFAQKDINSILGSLYGTLIVANSFDNTGVVIDNKEFITHLNLDRQPEGSPPDGGS